MRLIAFVTEATQVSKILDHIGVASEPPRIAPARGPRCGMTLTFRWARVSKSSRTGIWRRNRQATTRWNSASICDRYCQIYFSARNVYRLVPGGAEQLHASARHEKSILDALREAVDGGGAVQLMARAGGSS